MSEHIGAEEAQALLGAATPGEWRWNSITHRVHASTEHDPDEYVAFVPFEDDCPLIAAAPRLAAEVVRLRRELDARTDLLAALARVVWLLDNNPNVATFDRDDVAAAVGDQLQAARLLGGGE